VLFAGWLMGGFSAAAARGSHHRGGVSLIEPGHLPAPRSGSFVSLWPACACGRRTLLEQFSLSDGRRLGAFGRVWNDHGRLGVSDPHPTRGGSLLLTFSAGPRCAGSGRSHGPCFPVKNSCGGRAVRIDPRSGTVSELLRFPSSRLVEDAIPSPEGRQVVLIGGPCGLEARKYLTVRDLASGRQWTLGANLPRCTWLGPEAAWSPDSSHLIFPYAPVTRRPPRNPTFCVGTRLPGLVVARADRTSTSRSWKVIHADHRCGFLYGVFDPQGILGVEGCDYGQGRGSPGDPHLGDAFLVQLAGPDHHVIRRLELKRGFDGGSVVEDPRTGTVLISESQADNNGVKSYNWVWAYAKGKLRLIRRYPGPDASVVDAQPW
jgi:hypothetical protein